MVKKRTSKKRTKKNYKDAIGLINQPAKTTKAKQHYERIACVFQGGGALGAYQVGAYQAIHEHGYDPNYIAGVSIGAINGAIIAGNPREKRLEKLKEFWDTITPTVWSDALNLCDTLDITHHLRNRMGAMHSMFFGLDGFFKPRLLPPTSLTEGKPDKLSYYDTSELRTTLERLIDFDLINSKQLTLCVGAVNVTSGDMLFFNNQDMEITVDHIMASAALPPGFPAVKIGEDYYWDGGIYANTPLVTVLDALPEQDTLCFVVDCFSLRGPLPATMDQVEERQKDIRYGSHSRRMTNVYASRQNLQAAIHTLSQYLPAKAKEDPAIQAILDLAHTKHFSVVHIIYDGTPYSHSFKDYNFIRPVINLRMKTGYRNAQTVLSKPVWENKSEKTMTCSIFGVSSSYFEQH